MTSTATMTPSEFYINMCTINEVYHNDPEVMHSKMDYLMACVLERLGYGDGIRVFDHSEKWYA